MQISRQVKVPSCGGFKSNRISPVNMSSANKNIFSLVLHYSQFNYYITLF